MYTSHPEPYQKVRSLLFSDPNVATVERLWSAPVTSRWGTIVPAGYEDKPSLYKRSIVGGRWFIPGEERVPLINQALEDSGRTAQDRRVGRILEAGRETGPAARAAQVVGPSLSEGAIEMLDLMTIQAHATSRWPARIATAIGDAARIDLVLLHPPSVFNFRENSRDPGPVADVIPATPVFEMYPIGLTSIAEYVERNGYNVRLINVAYRMLKDPDFDPEAYLRRFHATVFGIDLHWLPHADGALRLAEIIRRVHPHSKILMGGISASYYHRELVAEHGVDFVLRGDSTEEPCRQLMQAMRGERGLETVENLTWRRGDGMIVVNPITHVPVDLDQFELPAYRYIVRTAARRGVHDLMPYLDWSNYPLTVLLTARGCLLNCAVCGGSRSAYRSIVDRTRPAFRSAERLIDDIRAIRTFSRAPIFVVHDTRMGGPARARRFFELLARERPPNEMIFELFFPAGDSYFDQIASSLDRWSLEMTVESHDEKLRRLNSKFPCSNEQLESTIASALAHGCEKFDMFFMVGIPGQTYESAVAAADYCEELLHKFHVDPRLNFFAAPLAPFLDPGCRAFEEPEFGYHSLRTLDEHRQALLAPSWGETLSYHTDTMSRAQIVAASEELGRRLDAIFRERRPERTALRAGRVANRNDLRWADHGRWRVTPGLARDVLIGVGEGPVHFVNRLLGRRDRHVLVPPPSAQVPGSEPRTVGSPVISARGKTW